MQEPLLQSQLCRASDWRRDWFARWCGELREPPRFHRKQWEFVYILQCLWERGCFAPGKKGLVFAVGTEPCPSLMANYGCEILATDIFPEEGKARGWTQGNQLCFGLESLNTRGLCTDEILRRQVRYRPVDMNRIPADLQGFDFNWSSCSFEHLGSLEKGRLFLHNQLRTLRPGGWSVHTTEYNLSSEEETVESGDTVVFRKKDILQIVKELEEDGHEVATLDWDPGSEPEDLAVDYLPHRQEVHLKLQLDRFIVTSIGLIIRKRPRRTWFRGL